MSREASVSARAVELRRHISYLARTASIELTTKEILHAAPYRKFLSPGTQVYIPHVPGTRVSDVVAAVKALASDGMVPVPHLAARRFNTENELDGLLEQLRESGCRQALVIGGSVPRPAGPFESALDILRSGKLQRAGFRRMGIAGYPEGSPVVKPEALLSAFRDKAGLAASGAFEMYIVSQFSFESSGVLFWEKNLRECGNRLPIHVGLPGVTSGTKLLRFAAICGVKASAGFLRHGAPALGRLLNRWSPGGIVLDIASQALRDPESMIRQLHFFPFGGFPDTVEWLKALGEGSYALEEENGQGRLVVEADSA
ncbi:MAG: methylenetetrahydrofolate reductase [Betaproteobacteria bacterium]|nr:methylenetetrahydrofolate reductase [Betaproteobacteria bacterium]